jgi:DNA gyrase subunit A
MVQVDDDDELMIITDAGKIIRLRVADISVIGRNTQGVRLIELEEGQKVAAVDRLATQPLNGVENGVLPPRRRLADLPVVAEPADDNDALPEPEGDA